MAVNRRLERAYGFGQGIYNLSPKPIVAKRAPTTHDMAEIGTIWVDQVGRVAYTLISVVGNVATWGNQAVIGALVANLTVNPGPLEVLSNANAPQQFLVDLNGGVAETAEIISQQGTGTAAILLAANVGGVSIEGGLANATAINLITSNVAGGITSTTGTGGEVHNTTGTVAFTSSDAVANAISLTATNAVGGIALSAANSTVNSTYLPVTGETHTLTNLPFTVATGTGAINISNDNAGPTVVNIGTGSNTSVKTLTLGSGLTTSTTVIRGGSTTGSIQLNASGNVIAAPASQTRATGPSGTGTANISKNLGTILWTGYTTAAAASVVFTLTDTTAALLTAASGILCTASIVGAEDAKMTVTKVQNNFAGNTLVITVTNNGTAALASNLMLTTWITNS